MPNHKIKFPPNGQAVSDLQSYPVLTEVVPAGTTSTTTRPAAGAFGGTSALGLAADKAIREVLSWRTKATDPKGFMTALNQAFDLKEVEGHTEFTWTPRSYTVQTDLGAVTGAQASIYTRAKVAIDQSLPLLDGLYALIPYVEAEDLATAQAVVRSQYTALVNEFGIEGGPRIARVNELFELLLGREFMEKLVDAGSRTNPDHVRGSLGLVKKRFGLDRTFVTTVDDEQNLTNFLILVDYVIGLHQSWQYEKGYFVRPSPGGIKEKEPYFGTQLVLLSRALDVVAQSVQDAYFAMDSVFMGDAERQVSQLNFVRPAGLPPVIVRIPSKDGGTEDYPFPRDTSGMFVAEFLDWVDRAASEELPRLLQDAGKDGIDSLQTVTRRLCAFARAAVGQKEGLPPGYYTPRVNRAMELVAKGLDETYRLALQIHAPEFPAEVSQREISSIETRLARLEQRKI